MRRAHGCGVQGMCRRAPSSGFALQFGVGGAALCWGVLWWLLFGGVQLWCPRFVLRWLVGHLGAATSHGGAGLFALVVINRWVVLSC
jgi:hypothetical protein